MITMARGENKAFKDRIGELSEPLMFQNIYNKIESTVDETGKLDHIDIESLVSLNETFNENWSRIQTYLEPLEDSSDLSEAEVQNQVEKYDALYEDFKQRHEASTT